MFPSLVFWNHILEMYQLNWAVLDPWTFDLYIFSNPFLSFSISCECDASSSSYSSSLTTIGVQGRGLDCCWCCCCCCCWWCRPADNDVWDVVAVNVPSYSYPLLVSTSWWWRIVVLIFIDILFFRYLRFYIDRRDNNVSLHGVVTLIDTVTKSFFKVDFCS